MTRTLHPERRPSGPSWDSRDRKTARRLLRRSDREEADPKISTSADSLWVYRDTLPPSGLSASLPSSFLELVKEGG